MGVTKSDFYTVKQNKLSNMLKALAHPARIAIIQQLIKSEHCICTDFVNEVGLAQATISQHLNELKEVGIIKGCVEGNSVSYCIDQKVWDQVKKELDAFFKAYEPVKDC
jgi:predicted transcriptional regulator